MGTKRESEGTTLASTLGKPRRGGGNLRGGARFLEEKQVEKRRTANSRKNKRGFEYKGTQFERKDLAH